MAQRENMGKGSFCEVLRFRPSGFTRLHEGERLDDGAGLAWIFGVLGEDR
jgi:hypothetical protein